MNSRSFFKRISVGILSFFIITILFVPSAFLFAQFGGNESQTGGNPNNESQTGGNPNEPIHLENPLASNVDSITEFVQLIINKIVLPIGSVVVVIVFIYAGFLFVTSQGNETKLETAKSTFWWAVIGSAILLGAFVITSIIQETVCGIAENIPGCN